MFIAATSECLRTPLGVPYHSEHVGLDHPTAVGGIYGRLATSFVVGDEQSTTAVGGLPESSWNEVSTETR